MARRARALTGLTRGAVLVESSTLTVGWIEELAREAAAPGLELLDVPGWTPAGSPGNHRA